MAQFGLVAVVTVLGGGLSVLASKSAEREFFAAPAAPNFSLNDTSGQTVSLTALRGKTIVLVFSSINCPVSNDYAARIATLSQEIERNPRMKMFVLETGDLRRLSCQQELDVQRTVIGQRCPTLLDAGGAIASEFGVERTPTVCIIDSEGGLRYRGSFDDHRDESKVRQHYALDALRRLATAQPTRPVFVEAHGTPIRPGPIAGAWK